MIRLLSYFTTYPKYTLILVISIVVFAVAIILVPYIKKPLNRLKKRIEDKFKDKEKEE